MKRVLPISLASMTKPVTTVAMPQLVEQGLVELDEPMSDYLADFEAKPILLRVGADGPVLSEQTYTPTIRQLLSHSSGFGYSIWDERLFAISDFANFTPTYFLDEPLIAVPDSEWNYSTSTDWAGLIVERVSGQTLEAYFAEHVTRPLAMDDTSYMAGDRLRPRPSPRASGSDSCCRDRPDPRATGPVLPCSPQPASERVAIRLGRNRARNLIARLFISSSACVRSRLLT